MRDGYGTQRGSPGCIFAGITPISSRGMFAGTQTHATLLARLSEGADPGAWHEFCARYGELIRNVALRRGVQAADADDILQDVLLALTKAMPGFVYDPAKGKFRAYLKTVVLHAIYRKSRQNGPDALLSEEAASSLAAKDGDEAAWEAEWRQYHLRLAMRSVELEFNENDLAAFDRYAVGGEEARAVAESLGLSIDQVYQAKSRITRRLAELIERQVADEG